MQITLIRHGKTFGNTKKQYIGTTDEALCEIGISEINSCISKYPKAEHVFISPMKRAVETKNIIYKDISQSIINDLRECSFGDFERRTYEELKGNLAYKNWIEKKEAIPNGEAYDDFKSRTHKAYKKCIDECIENGFKETAIIAHGGTIMAIMDEFTDDEKSYYDFMVQNGSGYICTVGKDYKITLYTKITE